MLEDEGCQDAVENVKLQVAEDEEDEEERQRRMRRMRETTF